MYAGHALCIACGGGGHGRLDGGRTGDCAIFHAIQADVVAVDGLAIDFGGDIDARGRLANQREVGLGLDRYCLFRHFPGRIGRHQFAKGDAATWIGRDDKGRTVDGESIGRHIEYDRGLGAQHFAQGGRGLTQRREDRRNGTAAAGAKAIRRPARRGRLDDASDR